MCCRIRTPGGGGAKNKEQDLDARKKAPAIGLESRNNDINNQLPSNQIVNDMQRKVQTAMAISNIQIKK